MLASWNCPFPGFWALGVEFVDLIAEELEYSVTSSIKERLAGATEPEKAKSPTTSGEDDELNLTQASSLPSSGGSCQALFCWGKSPSGSLQSGGMVKKFFCLLNAKSSTTIGSSESALKKNTIISGEQLA